MWKRGGRSSALDRAEAVLSAKKSSTGATEPTRRSVAIAPELTRFKGGSTKVRSAPPNAQTLLSDLSDLSSVSLSPRSRVDVTFPGGVQRTADFPAKGSRPQSSQEGKEGLGGRSRFLKKVPPSSSYSRGATFSKGQTHPEDPSNVPSSRHSSQTAVISRLAQIESRIHSRQQTQKQATSEIVTIPSPPKVEERPVSALSSSDEGQKGKRFLKNRTAVANVVAVGSPPGSSFGTGQPKTADVVTSAMLEKKPPKVVSGVCLESDEEDMRKLLGECVDSGDESLIGPGRLSSVRTMAKELKTRPPPAPSPPSNAAPPRSPTSSTSRGSPYRFTGNVQAHFSPTALSPSPSPPPVSPSRPNYIERADSTPCSRLSSSSGRNEVLSLEELFPVEDPHSDRSSVSSPDFKMNVMTIDDLIPAAFTEETQREQREVKPSFSDPASLRKDQPLLRLGDEEEKNEDESLKSKSDAQSEIKTETVNSAREVSESLLEDEEEVMSGAGKEAWKSDPRSESVEYDYSSCFTDATSQISEQSRTSESFRKSRDSRSSMSHSGQVFGQQKRRSAPKDRKNVKEAAVQTQLDGTRYAWSNGTTIFDPPPAMTYSPLAAYTLSADRVEALSTFSPAAFALNEVLKQHLAMTRRFIESARRLHSSRVQSLEPPNYRYTTLEDTKEFIRKQRASRLMVD
ncbi:uncharacterized protein C19orf44 isoform X2 [Cynoglossus semilaevis]|uniref:Chromosome 14 C19orf44 homolog n=1 Tax=Cynoglossus semilaevis TaxID=244447 RepID=A0A3P8W2P3_CYNSE|nr:uncharacterized protein C19orf44 homolog isoform X2 [Cynoglossus semilaevis]